MSIVVDTNVFAIAENLNAGASDDCIVACLGLLLRIQRGYPLLVDRGDEILAEYISTLRLAQTSGLAVKLANSLWRTRNGNQGCQRIAITPADDPPGSYEEVPVALRDFDTDDQKFIAVAAASDGAAPIVAGLDGEWCDRQQDFSQNGISVQFACLADLLAQGQ